MRHRFLLAALTVLAFATRGLAAAGSDVRAVSLAAPSIPPGDTGAGDSGAGTFSSDGKFVFFLSSAPNLVTNDHNGVRLDLFRRELATGKTTLVSVRADGQQSADGPATGFSVSADGRFVAFSSYASDLVAGGDTNEADDIFVRDLQLGVTRLVSATTAGGPGFGESSAPVLSADEKFVLFESTAADLVTGDANQASDVFLRDLAAGTTALVSARTNGVAGNQQSSAVLLSADAEVILFRSDATDLVPAVTGKNTTDLFLRRRSTGVTTRFVLPGVPVSATALPVRTFNHVLSADGRHLAFRTQATAGVTAPKEFEGVWWFDLGQGTSNRVSGALLTDAGYDDASGPVMSADGRTLAFEAQTSRTASPRVAVWSADGGLRTLDELVATVPPGGFPEPAASYSPVLSPDGSLLAFQTDSAVPAAGVTEEGDFRLYVRTLATGATKTPGVEVFGAFDSATPEFSPDGRSILFQSDAAFPGTDDRNQAVDIFLAPVGLEKAELLTARDPGLPQLTASGLNSLGQGSVSDDGGRLVFTSTAGDLVANDHNGTQDVFAHDTATVVTTLVSVGLDGESPASFSSQARMSGNGRFVVFTSSATNLVAGDTNGFADVFVRDLVAGTTVLASAKDDGTTSGNNSAGNGVISADGRYVAFESRATDLVPGTVGGTIGNVFLRDLAEGRTYWLSANSLLPGVAIAGSSSGPVISKDGQTVALLGGASGQTDLYLFSVGAKKLTRATLGQRTTAAVLNADGTRAAFLGTAPAQSSVLGAFWRDNVAGTNALIAVSTNTLRSFTDVAISADGRRVAFASNFVPDGSGDTNGVNDVFAFDIASGVLTRASSPGVGGVANGASAGPVLSADGRLVAFHSTASNLVADDTNGAGDVFVRDLQTGGLVLVSRRVDNGRPGNATSNRPMLSADGRTLAFLSSADDLVAGDYNFQSDIFVAPVPEVPAYDSEPDGLPDELERALFGDLSRTGNDDFDGDGVSDRDEFLAGTDLKDAQSFLKLVFSGFGDTGSAMLSWRTVAGVNYQFQSSAQLGQGWNNPGLVVTGDGGLATVSADSGAESAFFRLVVLPR